MPRIKPYWVAFLLAGCASASSNDVRDLSQPDLAEAPKADLSFMMPLPPPPDLSTLPDLALPNPKAVLTGVGDYVGLPSTLDGSKSSDPRSRTLTFTWHLQAPAGSMLNDASLTPAGAAGKVSFVGDVGGSYVVSLTVSTPDGSNDTATVTLDVPTAPIFFYEGTVTAQGQQIGVGMVRSDGRGRHALGCPLAVDAGAGTIPYSNFAESARFGLRTFDAARPAMGPAPKSRVLFIDEQRATFDGGAINEWRLWSGDEGSSCAGQAPVRIDDPNAFNDHPHLYPRFSPDGQRVAYLDGNHNASTMWRLVTVGVDGSDRRVVRGPTKAIYPTPPAWMDATHLAWVENTQATSDWGDPRLAVYASVDAAGAGDPGTGTPTTITYCYNDTLQQAILKQINQVEFVTGGMIIVGSPNLVDFLNPPYGMAIYRISGGVCATDNKLAEEPGNGKSWDVALSPDGKTLAFSSTRGNLPDGAADATKDIWVVPADGSGPPTRLAGDKNFDDFGPRWIAGGKQLMWTQQGTDPDGGYPRGGGIMIINADGTNPRSLIAQRGDSDSTTIVLGGSNAGHVGCSWSGAFSDGTGALGLGLLGALFFIALVRRRAGG
jgi:hypothetical protein